MSRQALRKQLRRSLALPMLVAALTCVALPLPALAQSGRGHDRSQQDDSDYEQYRDQRDRSNDNRGNGKNHGNTSDHGSSAQKHQSSQQQDYYGNSRGEQSERGRSQEQYRAPETNKYNNGRNTQQYQSLSPQQAAQRARSQYGGKVLKVQPGSQGYQVRILKDDGRVVTVPIAE